MRLSKSGMGDMKENKMKLYWSLWGNEAVAAIKVIGDSKEIKVGIKRRILDRGI